MIKPGNGPRFKHSQARFSVLALFIAFLAPNTWAAFAQIERMKGTVQFREPNTVEWNDVRYGDKLQEGTAVRTGPRSQIDLKLSNGHKIRLTQDSVLTLSHLQDDETQGTLEKG